MCAFDSAFPPACAICCSCLSVSICGRKPAGTEDAPKRSEESPVKSDQDGDCRWTTGSRRLGTAPTKSEGEKGGGTWEEAESLISETIDAEWIAAQWGCAPQVGNAPTQKPKRAVEANKNII